MNKFVKHYIEKYYFKGKPLSEGINFNDLDDSSEEDGFNNTLKKSSIYVLKEKYTQLINRYLLEMPSYLIDGNSDYAELLSEMTNIYEKVKQPLYKASSLEELDKVIGNYMKLYGYKCNLNWIDTSEITDMTLLFCDNTNFNGDISKWDVSNVIDMESMFAYSNFNGDISLWDVSNVTNMSDMFAYSNFNGDISLWDVSNVNDLGYMFANSKFNLNISQWNVINVQNTKGIFYKCPIKDKYKPIFATEF